MPQLTKDEGRRAAWAEAWRDPDAFATTLVHMFHDRYFDPGVPASENCYTWHPGTILMEIRDDFRVELPRPNFDRLMAGISLVTSDEFYRNVPTFIDLCNVLSGEAFDPSTFDVADAGECAWGITEALLLSPPDDDDESPFSGEVRAYIGKVLDREGIIDPPDVLRLGERDGDYASRARDKQAEDRELSEAIREAEAEKTGSIIALVRGNLSLLVRQLGRLQLAGGDAGNLAARLSSGI